jgi:hypothetical protein
MIPPSFRAKSRSPLARPIGFAAGSVDSAEFTLSEGNDSNGCAQNHIVP